MKQSIILLIALISFLSTYAQDQASHITVEDPYGKYYCEENQQILNFSEQGVISAYSPPNNVHAVGLYNILEDEQKPGHYSIEYYITNHASTVHGYENIISGEFYILSWTKSQMEMWEDGEKHTYHYLGEAPDFDQHTVPIYEGFVLARNAGQSLPNGWKDAINSMLNISKASDAEFIDQPYESTASTTSGSNTQTTGQSSSDNSTPYVADKALLGKWYAKEFNTVVEFGENEVFTAYTPNENSSMGLYGVKRGTNIIKCHYTTTVLAEFSYRFKDPKTLIITYKGESSEYKYIGEPTYYSPEDGKKVGQIIIQGIDKMSAQMSQFNAQMMNQMHRTNMMLINNLGGNTELEYYEVDQYGNKVRKY